MVAMDTSPPEVGQVAPEFRTKDDHGLERSLSEMCRERPLVLVFYRGHW
jgi:peroxiredoxin